MEDGPKERKKNHVNRGTKELVSVIITLGNNISGTENLFYDSVKTSDLRNRYQVLNIYMAELFLVHLIFIEVLFREDAEY